MDDEEWTRNLVYRIAYGPAYRMVEQRAMTHDGPDPDRLLSKLAADVERQMGGDPETREAIADGVADAVEGRQPRW